MAALLRSAPVKSAPIRQAPASSKQWTQRYSKPALPRILDEYMTMHLKQLQEPEKFTPEHLGYPLIYYSPGVIARAYEEATRQLSLIA